MKEILKKYCSSEIIKPGLLLLSMPTGFGKTHNVLDFIYENYDLFKQQGRKIIFITNLKKNLPCEELKERFIRDGREKEYQENVLFIDSNSDFVIRNFLDLEHEIPQEFKTESYHNLKKQLKLLAKSKNSDKDLRDLILNQIRTDFEPKFRKSITEKLNKKCKNKADRLEIVKNNPDYQWIGKLYPTVFTDEKTVLFMSMDKFFLKNTTIIEPSYYCYQRLSKDSLIFIDEFDATKETILNQIIESGIKHKIDLINLFLNIHNHLMKTEFPDFMLQESKSRKKAAVNKNWKSLPEIIEEFKRESIKIFEEYNLQYVYKLHQDNLTDENSRNFLFYDYQSHYVLDSRQNIIIDLNNENKVNWIKTVFNNNEQFKDNPRISSLLGQIGGFLTYFQRGISFLAQNYQDLKKENGNENFTLEFAISSVLDGFKLDRETIKFLTTNIIENYNPFQAKNETTITQIKSFYETGFRYHDIVDKEEHDISSKIYFYNFNRTPESFLAEVCNQAMVIGISATASMDTNIGNYDIKYLRNHLKDSFKSLSQDEIERLQKDYENLTKGYDKVSIQAQFIGAESQDEALEKLEKILDDEETANSLLEKCPKSESEKKTNRNYKFCRYVGLLEAWQYFNLHSDCQAFLCFLNKFPKSNDSEFNIDILYQYFCYVNNIDATKNNLKKIKNQIVLLSSHDFDQELKKLKERLGNGERIFIISTYQTLGAGVNLQYPIPEGYQPIKINQFDQRSEMDISGVYLEKPTNLLVPLNDSKIEDKDKNFIKHLFQLEFLLVNGTMSPQQFQNKLEKAFNHYIGESYFRGKPEAKINLYQTAAFTKFLNKVIIQALGRICRTNMKAKTIHILADHAIKQSLNRVALPKDIIPVKEYNELIKEAKQSPENSDEMIEIQNRAVTNSRKCHEYIKRLLNIPWNDKTIREWKSLREQVLRQPTIVNSNDCETKWTNTAIYLELPIPSSSYRFSQEDDYRYLEFFFANSGDAYEVSEATSHLTELMKIELLKNLFINSKYATSFPKSQLMLTPIMFNNIYKGALGEVCGKHILETKLNIELLELNNDEYERFDFKTQEGVYLDFKFWSDNYQISEEEELEKIRLKINRINTQKVIIINILAKEDRKFIPLTSDNGKIIRVPFLCQNNQISQDAIKFLLQELI